MQYNITYDIESGVVLQAEEKRVSTMTFELSDDDYQGFLNGEKQLFVRDGLVTALNQRMSVETRSAVYEAVSE